MLHIASAVDPRFKALPFLTEEERERTFSRLQTEVVDRMEEGASDVSNNPVEKIQVNRSSLPSLFLISHTNTQKLFLFNTNVLLF